MVSFILLLWSVGFLLLWKVPRIRTSGPPPASLWPVSIIVPARNEENNLARLLVSLENQIPPESEILVVDDHSEDATARIAHHHAVRLILSRPLPAGWLGKPWACWQGGQEARNDLFLFLDADTFFEPEGLPRLIEEFGRTGSPLFIQPYHRMRKPYEQLSAYFNLIVMAGSNACTVLGERIQPNGGFGPCLICSKEDYDRVGGHQKVASRVIEHFILGREFLNIGRTIRCRGGKGVLNFQMYPGGFRSMVQGFKKSFFLGSQAISFWSLVLLSAWITGAMALTRHLGEEAFSFSARTLLTWIGVDLLFAGQLFWMLVRIGNFRWWTALFFQVPLVFFTLVFASSLIDTLFRRKVAWKGRRVKTE